MRLPPSPPLLRAYETLVLLLYDWHSGHDLGGTYVLVYDRFAQLRFNYIGEDRSYGPKDLYKRESDSVASLDSYSYTN
jgi:hypothetical protein